VKNPFPTLFPTSKDIFSESLHLPLEAKEFFLEDFTAPIKRIITNHIMVLDREHEFPTPVSNPHKKSTP